MLSVETLDVFYGDAQALDGVSLEVEEGAIVAIVGANGAGKTSLIRTIAGMLRPARGAIRYRGSDIAGWPSHQVCDLGIGQVAEGRQVFPTLTVAENLDMGAMLPRAKAQRETNRERVFALFPRLAERKTQVGGTMSGGEQQMLAIGRALMSNPRLLLLDEPSMGLAPQFIRQIFSIITEINKQGTTVLLVEQNANQALARAHRAFVLETGAITHSGTGKELLTNPAIKEA